MPFEELKAAICADKDCRRFREVDTKEATIRLAKVKDLVQYCGARVIDLRTDESVSV